MLDVLVVDFLVGRGKDEPTIYCHGAICWIFLALHTLTNGRDGSVWVKLGTPFFEVVTQNVVHCLADQAWQAYFHNVYRYSGSKQFYAVTKLLRTMTPVLDFNRNTQRFLKMNNYLLMSLILLQPVQQQQGKKWSKTKSAPSGRWPKCSLSYGGLSCTRLSLYWMCSCVCMDGWCV